jgi:hypothetical protein
MLLILSLTEYFTKTLKFIGQSKIKSIKKYGEKLLIIKGLLDKKLTKFNSKKKINNKLIKTGRKS